MSNVKFEIQWPGSFLLRATIHPFKTKCKCAKVYTRERTSETYPTKIFLIIRIEHILLINSAVKTSASQ